MCFVSHFLSGVSFVLEDGFTPSVQDIPFGLLYLMITIHLDFFFFSMLALYTMGLPVYTCFSSQDDCMSSMFLFNSCYSLLQHIQHIDYLHVFPVITLRVQYGLQIQYNVLSTCYYPQMPAFFCQVFYGNT